MIIRDEVYRRTIDVSISSVFDKYSLEDYDFGYAVVAYVKKALELRGYEVEEIDAVGHATYIKLIGKNGEKYYPGSFPEEVEKILKDLDKQKLSWNGYGLL